MLLDRGVRAGGLNRVLPMMKIAITGCLATVLWVVPSVGTRGQGTLGDRFVHADRDLVADTATGHAMLRQADSRVGDAVSRL